VRSAVNSGVGACTDNSCNVGQCVDEMANVSIYQCNTGYKFEHNGLRVRYSRKKGVKYLKCVVESCPGRATVKNGVIYTTGEHVQHDDVKEEIDSEFPVNAERERQKMTHIYCDKYSMRYVTGD